MRPPTPFFEAESAAGQLSRRLVLISYHFPPSREMGSLRWEKFSRIAAERGWGLDVITLAPESQPKHDMSRVRSLPPGVRVFGVDERRAWPERAEGALYSVYCRLRRRRREAPAPPSSGQQDRPGAAGSLKFHLISAGDWRRSFYAWLDYVHFGAWADAAAEQALPLIQPGVHRAVITCGPPHMAHEGGRRVAAATRLPFIMDLRDPWSLIQRLPEAYAAPKWLDLARRYESRAVQQASLVVMNTEPAREAMARRYPEHSPRIITVLNGYDDDPLPPMRPTQQFVVAYAGTIYLDRDPRLLLRAAARVVREHGLTPERFKLLMVGNVDTYGGVPIGAMARQEGLAAAFLDLRDFMTRHELMELLAEARMLVSLPQDSDMAIPGKIYEYLRMPAWLLALNTETSATGRLLQGTGADVVAPDDVDAIATALRTRYDQFASGVQPRPPAADDSLSRRTQANRLFDAIEGIVGR